MTRLRYTFDTSAGHAFHIQFPVHSETGSARAVAGVLIAIPSAIGARVEAERGLSDGDVLQTLAMVRAVRARMVAVPPKTSLYGMHGLVVASVAATLSASRYQAARG
jgi:hypothetical protein